MVYSKNSLVRLRLIIGKCRYLIVNGLLCQESREYQTEANGSKMEALPFRNATQHVGAYRLAGP